MFRSVLSNVLNPLRAWLAAPVLADLHTVKSSSFLQQSQVLLSLQYAQLQQMGLALPRLGDVGFRVYSESDEDGILHYIFSLIGTRAKKLVDIGAGQIAGSNTANLLINRGWSGLLIDGDPVKVQDLERFYLTCPETRNYPPKCVSVRVTGENINSVLEGNGLAGEVDLLCIDIDGIDYWIWKAVETISPRVVVVEYQCIWGAGVSVTVPYDPNFRGIFEGPYAIYSGASLAAFVKLARIKGYRLVGCQKYGYNAFFVRSDVSSSIIPEIAIEECFVHPFAKWAADSFLEKIRNLDWVEI